MFYKALGFAVWRIVVGYLRWRFGRTLRVAAVAGVVGIAGLAAAGYIARRSGGE